MCHIKKVNCISVYGGCNAVNSVFYNDLFIFNPLICTWTAVTVYGAALPKCASHDMIYAYDQLIILGGINFEGYTNFQPYLLTLDHASEY
jgi:hypothetical protein